MSSYLAHKRKGFQGAAPLAFNGFGNRSRSFDGVDDKVTIAVDPVDDEPITISAWVKLDTITQVGGIFNIEGDEAGSGNEGFGLLVVNGEFWAYSQEVGIFDKAVSTSTLNTTEWWHVCGVFRSPTDREIYINGTSEGTNTTSVNPSTTIIDNACIGNRANTNNDQDFSGKIADVRIYDTDLTASQISDLYNGTNITTNLVGHWLTDADNLLDAAGSNNGTNYGSKYSYDNPSPPVEFGSASRSFNGSSDYIDLGDSDDFSFGDGVNDSAFSVCVWVKAVDISIFRILTKEGGFGLREWQFTTDSVGRLSFFVADNSSNTLRGRKYSSPLSTNIWYAVSMTYDGRGGDSPQDGISLYVNGSRVDDTDYTEVNTYVAMHNTTQAMEIGSIGFNNTYADGNIADVRLYDTDLTASQVSDLASGVDVQTNLVGHWLTDNDDVEDKAGTNDGTNFGSTYSYDNPPMDLVPSRQASRSFDGVSDYIDLGDSDDFSFTDGAGNDQPFSLCCWAKMDSNDKFRVLHKSAVVGGSAINELFFGTLGSGEHCFLLSGGDGFWYGIKTPSAIVENEWVHISATYDGSGGVNFRDGMNIYINGVAVSPVVFGSTGYTGIANGVYPLWIARYQNNNTHSDGKIADVRIYDAELTASQILAIYNGTTDRTNLIGQWLTNSDDVVDHAGTNDGTNNGSTYSTDSPS